MNEDRFAAALADMIEIAADDVGFGPVAQCRTFRSVGMMSDNAGLVVNLEDGSQYQVTVVQSKQPRGGR